MHQMRSSVLQNLTYDDQGTHQGNIFHCLHCCPIDMAPPIGHIA